MAVRSASLLQKWTQAPYRRHASLLASLAFRCSRDESTGHQVHNTAAATHNFAVGPRSLLPSSVYSITITSPVTATSIRQKTNMVPRKAAIALTPKAREIFQKLIAATGSEGIMLKYEISSQNALRMTFKFDLIKDATKELTAQDEGVSLEVLEDGVTPKPPSESWDDNLAKLYIHHAAFMKVLGGTLDVDFDSETGDLTPKLFDREGHEMDPNA